MKKMTLLKLAKIYFFLFTFLLTSLSFSQDKTIDYYNSSTSTSNENADWMKSLSNSKTVTTLSIPGTHDSGALYGGDLAICQTLSVLEQLKAGIRYFDIRLSYYPNEKKFYVYHGITYQHLTLKDVLDNIKSFLDDHPSEAVFVRIKRESDSNTDDVFVTGFKEVMNSYGINYFYTKSSVPIKLGDIRKKIVIIENVSGLPGIKWGAIPKQDEYYVSAIWNRWWKFEQVRNFIDKYKTDTSKLVLNHSSGSSSGCYPYTTAKYVNYYVLRYIQDNTDIKKTGIIAMDFPGDKLINEIINVNKR
ncbi:putative 1-phosphatidylinositol phosphodiesterase [Tenacibaculum sediminilitoris]|uniref:phosphatidylinositol-specific phospholipase C n=1 Tax=Tenacibaculum sediminilitoris TaxID=1820334 RepID=UPI003893D0A9